MEYTVLAVASVVAVVALELAWLRTGIFAKAQFWIAYAIIVFFEVLVDGWLTKLPPSRAIVLYDPEEITGWRFPFDIPVEDYLFGFSLIVLTLMLWIRAGARRGGRAGAASGPAGAAPTPPR